MHPYARDSQTYWMLGNDQGQGQEQTNQTWNDPNQRYPYPSHLPHPPPSHPSHPPHPPQTNSEFRHYPSHRPMYDSEDIYRNELHPFPIQAMPEHNNELFHVDEELYPTLQMTPPPPSHQVYKSLDGYMAKPSALEENEQIEDDLFEKNNGTDIYRNKGLPLDPSLMPPLMPLEQAKSTPLPEQFGARDSLKKGIPMSNDYPNLTRATSTADSHRFQPPISNQDMLVRRINDLKLQTKTNNQLFHELQNQFKQQKSETLQRSLNIREDTEDEKVIENVPKEIQERNDSQEENNTVQNIKEENNKKLDWREFSKRRIQKLEEILDKLAKKNEAMEATVEALESFRSDQLEKARERLAEFQEQRQAARRVNISCELEIMELQDQVNTLREKLDHGKHETFLNSSAAEEVRLYDDNVSLKESEDLTSYYLSEASVQQNLIRAQVEFYFSDYSLKRDKRLLERICAEPRGYLPVKEVLQLPRIRQLCNNSKQLLQALQKSPCIDIYKDESHIGRKNFRAPSEKMFPFRRTVFVYGLPQTADESYVKAMLTPFGGVVKVEMDKGPDTLDRAIMARLMEKHRVFKLLSKDTSAFPMKFDNKGLSPVRTTDGAPRYHVEKDRNGTETMTQYECIWCDKVKSTRDGYYQGATPIYLVCLQCAAARAEEQLGMYETQSRIRPDAHDRLRDLLIGLPPRQVSQCQTALCVFASQRQASKCVYVRSRLAYNGSFATHYHHYSKLKKDIALQSPYIHN